MSHPILHSLISEELRHPLTTGDSPLLDRFKFLQPYMTDFRRPMASWATVLALFFLSSSALAIPIHRQLTARSDVVCVPATWQDIIAFFALNYATHALTIKSFPGDTTETTIWMIVFALFVPFAGVWRACLAIENGTFKIFAKDDFQDAARAGALCAVFRSRFWK